MAVHGTNAASWSQSHATLQLSRVEIKFKGWARFNAIVSSHGYDGWV